jgi:hypothetical protein
MNKYKRVRTIRTVGRCPQCGRKSDLVGVWVCGYWEQYCRACAEDFEDDEGSVVRLPR